MLSNYAKPFYITRKRCIQCKNLLFKGGGGFDDPGKVKTEFSVVADREECQLPDAFYQIKNCVPIGFWNLENMGDYSTHVNFKRNFQKMDFFGIYKSIFSYKFWNRPSKLGSYVLGVKTQVINPAEFWLRPLKSKYSFLKIESDILWSMFCHWKFSKINTCFPEWKRAI